ncbi:MAG: hydroxyethylthiazole kinase [Bacteroidia bacterium]|nr:hydroxyethylthiazole kinase [Bacteroidia bacterium]
MELQKIWENIRLLRESAPLIHNITNYVVMNNTANALLAAGASPVMAHAPEEVEDMVKIAQALVINIGTLSRDWVDAMKLAISAAARYSKPWVLDPVGAGATPYRNQVIAELLEIAPPTAIRGNASEIMAMVASGRLTKGVDSQDSSLSAMDSGQILHQKYQCVVCISGKTDIVIASEQRAKIHNGHALMAQVTGLGCTATTLIAAFLAITTNPFEAVMSAMALMGIAGELAAQEAAGPGSLQMHLLDKLYNLSQSEFDRTVKVEIG